MILRITINLVSRYVDYCFDALLYVKVILMAVLEFVILVEWLVARVEWKINGRPSLACYTKISELKDDVVVCEPSYLISRIRIYSWIFHPFSHQAKHETIYQKWQSHSTLMTNTTLLNLSSRMKMLMLNTSNFILYGGVAFGYLHVQQ